MKKLEIEYDLVVIIDCLPNEQKEKYKIASDLMNYLASKGIKQLAINCNSKNDLFNAFNKLLTIAESKKFCLHIISHGNKKGIGIVETQELVTWEEFNFHLSKLNHKLSNTLILNMTSCKGLYGIKAYDDKNENSPFFGLVGCNRNLKVKEGKMANELFYKMLIEGKNISEIIPEIQEEFKKIGTLDNVIYSISSEGYQKIKKRISKNKTIN